MVKIAIAGGSGEVAQEVTDALISANKHEITILSRKNPSPDEPTTPGTHWRLVDYSSKSDLVSALQGIETVLSFIQVLSDPAQEAQRNLIDACVLAGVKRFAPSEYGSPGVPEMPWYAGKDGIRKYLREVNKNGTVLEYTLFQPGLFLDYLASPYKTAKHITPLDTIFDFQHCRAMVVEGYEDAIITLTSAADLAAMVARAVDFPGTWPEIGGIRGNRVTFKQVLEIGERVRGRAFAVDRVKMEELEAGILKTEWVLGKRHHAVSEELTEEFLVRVPISILLSCVKGMEEVSDELNQLSPGYECDDMEAFLTRVWEGKP